MIQKVGIRTRTSVEFIDITRDVQEVVAASKTKSGVCHVFVPHTTAAVTLNENADPSVAADIIAQLDEFVPRQGNYQHSEGNAHAHIKASLIGNSVTLLIDGGDLVLGTWQGLFFCEFDGPRSRTLLVKIVPDLHTR